MTQSTLTAETIADTVAKMSPSYSWSVGMTFADEFRNQSPQFDWRGFLSSCGLTDSEIDLYKNERGLIEVSR